MRRAKDWKSPFPWDSDPVLLNEMPEHPSEIPVGMQQVHGAELAAAFPLLPIPVSCSVVLHLCYAELWKKNFKKPCQIPKCFSLPPDH